MADLIEQQGADINAVVPAHIRIGGTMVGNEKLGSWADIKNAIRKHTSDKGDLEAYAKKYLRGPPAKRRKTASNDEQPPATGAAASTATRAELAIPAPANNMIQTFLVEQAQNQMAFMGQMRDMMTNQYRQQLALQNGGEKDAMAKIRSMAVENLLSDPEEYASLLAEAADRMIDRNRGVVLQAAVDHYLKEHGDDEVLEMAAKRARLAKSVCNEEEEQEEEEEEDKSESEEDESD